MPSVYGRLEMAQTKIVLFEPSLVTINSTKDLFAYHIVFKNFVCKLHKTIFTREMLVFKLHHKFSNQMFCSTSKIN